VISKELAEIVHCSFFIKEPRRNLQGFFCCRGSRIPTSTFVAALMPNFVKKLVPSRTFALPTNHAIMIEFQFFDGCSTAEITQTVEEIKKTVALHQPQSLIALLDITGTTIDKERINIIQSMAAHNRPYIRFIALVGLGFFRSMAFRVMLRLTGRKNHRVFGTRERALDWLGGR
jgi:hypothetical protein